VSAPSRKLRGGGLPVTLEITPPRERNPALLPRRASPLRSAADAIQIVESVLRMSSLDTSLSRS
jgi:hypothetical protein